MLGGRAPAPPLRLISIFSPAGSPALGRSVGRHLWGQSESHKCLRTCDVIIKSGLDSAAQTLILVQILVEILIVVEVAEHEGGLGGDHAGLLLHLVHVLCNSTSTISGHHPTLRRPLTNVDEVRGRVLALPPQPVNLVPGHPQAWTGDSELNTDASATRLLCSRAGNKGSYHGDCPHPQMQKS